MAAPLAFAILAHDDPVMLRRLVGRLAPYRCHVHIDARARDFDPAVLDGLDHAQLIERRVAVHWADFSVVEAMLALLEAVAAEGAPGHTVLLSGHCYPIRPVEALAAHCAERDGIDLMQSVAVRPHTHLARLSARHWQLRPWLTDATRQAHPVLARTDDAARRLYNRLTLLAGRDIGREIAPATLHYGSQWWALSAASVTQLLTSAADPRWHALRSVFAADEHFAQTLLANSPRAAFREGPQDDRGPDTLLDAPLHMIAPAPDRRVIDTPETRASIAASPRFFLRKLRGSDTELLDWIDARCAAPPPGVTPR